MMERLWLPSVAGQASARLDGAGADATLDDRPDTLGKRLTLLAAGP